MASAERWSVRELRAKIDGMLYERTAISGKSAHGYPPVTNDEVFKEIFEQAENFKKHNG